jgi:hypothetical protein
MPTGGLNSYLFLLKDRTKGVYHQLQAHVRNSIGNLGNPMEPSNPTQMLSYDGMNNQPPHLANIDFSSTKFSSVWSFFQVA